jgi:hypothetical protein
MRGETMSQKLNTATNGKRNAVDALRELLGGQADDPLFALRAVAENGVETRLLSSDMQATECDASIDYTFGDLPIRLECRLDGAALNITVTNAGPEATAVDFYGPLVTRLAERGCKAHIPQVGGVVFPVKDSNYLHHNSGQLASLFMILQTGEVGLALGHEKTSEDEGRYRSGIAVHGRGLPIGRYSGEISDKVGSAVENKMGDLLDGEPASELGGVACFTENMVLYPSESRALGPYLILPYTGSWTQGAALLRQHRYPRRYRPRPRWFESVHNLSEICCGAEKRFDVLASTWREQRAWGSPLFALCWFFKGYSKMIWGSSFRFRGGDRKMGGDKGLRRAIDDLHHEGAKVLFYVTPWSLTQPYDQARVCLDQKWNLQEHPGMNASPWLDYGEFGKFICPCPAHAPARKWVVEGIAETLEKYPIDGFFFDEAAAIINRPCHNPTHRHPHPYVWTYGNYEMFRDLRRAMDKINPETLIISEGGSELYREFIDGCLGHTNGWSQGRHEAPVTRAVVPEIAIFDSTTGGSAQAVADTAIKQGRTIMSSEQMLAVHFVGGIPYYLNTAEGRLERLWREHEEYRRAYPELFKGNIEACLPVFEPGEVIGYLIRHGETLILTAANLMGCGFADGQRIKVTLPVPAATLYDRVGYRYYEVRDGKAEIRLKPHGVVALEVLTI